jgi:dTDP-4-dehydrorhamnose 3,5-epimerase
MSFKISLAPISDVFVIEPKVFNDQRGFFFESYNQREFAEMTGLNVNFVQVNHSHSVRNVLRGLHYQVHHPQGKLVRVLQGEIFDVVVDLRCESPHFGKWYGLSLSFENKLQLWIPPGFAHGFFVTSETADINYKTTDYWYPEQERCIKWNDETIGIEWPLSDERILNTKDQQGSRFENAEFFHKLHFSLQN